MPSYGRAWVLLLRACVRVYAVKEGIERSCMCTMRRCCRLLSSISMAGAGRAGKLCVARIHPPTTVATAPLHFTALHTAHRLTKPPQDLARFDADFGNVLDEKGRGERTLRRLKLEQEDM